jgi:hypothetical protein
MFKNENFVDCCFYILYQAAGASMFITAPLLIVFLWSCGHNAPPKLLCDWRYCLTLLSGFFSVCLLGWTGYWSSMRAAQGPRRGCPDWQVNVALALACASFVFAVAQPVVFVGHRFTFITLAAMQLVNLTIELFVCLMALKNDWL